MTAVESLFDQLAALAADRRRPPVGSWQPARTGRIDIRIAADGSWYHDGGPIRRPALVKLFASILRRDPDGYCLVTPAEKLLIEVEDVPFIAVDMEVKGEGTKQSLLFLTNVDDCSIADVAHPIRVADDAAGPRPYVMVRDGLEARISRPVYYRLVALAAEEGAEVAVYSEGARFVLGRL
jgi:uncharacterized protein